MSATGSSVGSSGDKCGVVCNECKGSRWANFQSISGRTSDVEGYERKNDSSVVSGAEERSVSELGGEATLQTVGSHWRLSGGGKESQLLVL